MWSDNLTESQIKYIQDKAQRSNWFNFHRHYDEIAEKVTPPNNFRRFVELGTWKGLSIIHLAQRINKVIAMDEIEIYTVDDWSQTPSSTNKKLDLLREICLYNLERFEMNNLVKLLEMTSHEASMLFEDEYLDYVFIDADHSYEHIREDINDWLPKIKKGGMIAGHDYAPSQPGIQKAVDESFAGQLTFGENGVWKVDIN